MSDAWTPERFREVGANWLPILRKDWALGRIRRSLVARVNRLHAETFDKAEDLSGLDLVLVRDCARAWRSILHSRSEKLSQFSVLVALIDAAHGVSRPDVTPAFWADVCHLVDGVEGRARLQADAPPPEPPGVVGRALAALRSETLSGLGRAAKARMRSYPTGLDPESVERRRARADAVQSALRANASDWSDWRWQVRHIARDAESLGAIATLGAAERDAIARARAAHLPFGVTPYYASLFDDGPDSGRDRAIRAQVIPTEDYVSAMERPRDPTTLDFMNEAETSPIDLVTRRYPGIVILKPYNACPQICVYCQRNWEIDEPMGPAALMPADKLSAAIDWIGQRPEIDDVLITGGDPLVLSDARIESILSRLSALPHVARIRLGTRTPVTLPMRFTSALTELLGSFRVPGVREVCLVTHVEHPYEITPDFVVAIERLRRQGIPVYNQLVYTFFVSRRFEASALRASLRRCGVEPYYTFNTKGKAETAAFRVPIARLVQEQKEEARLLPGLSRTDEAVFNLPGIGKNPLNSWQHRDIISVLPSGARVYEFHPWEKKIAPQQTHVAEDVPILDYLERLSAIGETEEHYAGIWYYF